jgi:hypothetical protein
MRRFVYLPLLLAVVAGASCSRPTEWREHISKPGGFRVLFPRAPSHSVQHENSDSIVMHTLSANDDGSSTVFEVDYCDFARSSPPNASSGAAPPDVVESAKAEPGLLQPGADDVDAKTAAPLRQALANASRPEVVLQSACEGTVENYHGTTKSNAPLVLDGFPGRELVFSGRYQNRPASVRARIYLVESRLYYLIVTRYDAEVEIADAARFFDSFRRIAIEDDGDAIE